MTKLLPTLIPWAVVLVLAAISYFRIQEITKALKKRQDEMSHRLYEIAILRELQDRIGYSLDVQQIADVIAGSLHQFIRYSVVSYMLLRPEQILFKAHVEKSVSRAFVDDVRDRMLRSLSALLEKPLDKKETEEVLTGALLLEDGGEPVRSFFNIPLVIGERAVGVLTIADTKADRYKDEEVTLLFKIIGQASKAISRLEEVVATEQRKLDSMVESMAEGVVMTDNRHELMVANPAARRALGLPPAAAVTIFDLIGILQSKLDLRGKLEESTRLDKLLEFPDVLIGDRYFHMLISPVKISSGLRSGEIAGNVVIFRDISREKELDQLRDNFMSLVIHELRSPLDGIRKITDLIIRKRAEVETVKIMEDYVPIIYKSSSDMLRLVNDLLDVAKIEAGKFEIVKESADIRKVIADKLAFYDIPAREAGVTLATAFDPALPPVAPFDPAALGEVLNNLIANALRFTGSGGTVTVQAFAHAKGGDLLGEAKRAGVSWFVKTLPPELAAAPAALLLAVTDSGVGMKAADVPLLFNKFKQFRNSAVARGDKKGTGLGLVISKGIVEAHGGFIAAASEEGKGSTFYFSIPL